MTWLLTYDHRVSGQADDAAVLPVPLSTVSSVPSAATSDHYVHAFYSRYPSLYHASRPRVTDPGPQPAPA